MLNVTNFAPEMCRKTALENKIKTSFDLIKSIKRNLLTHRFDFKYYNQLFLNHLPHLSKNKEIIFFLNYT